MYCKWCGHPIRPGDGYCSVCGHPISEEDRVSNETNEEYYEEASYDSYVGEEEYEEYEEPQKGLRGLFSRKDRDSYDPVYDYEEPRGERRGLKIFLMLAAIAAVLVCLYFILLDLEIEKLKILD